MQGSDVSASHIKSAHLMAGKVIHQDVEAVKRVGRANGEQAEIRSASLDNRADTATGICLARAKEDIHLALAYAHVIGEGPGVEASVGQTETALMPVLDGIERLDLTVVLVRIVVRERFGTADLADEEEQDTLGGLKFERDAMDGALIISRAGLLALILVKVDSSAGGQNTVEQVAKSLDGQAELLSKED
jgi:hypothetical protein